MTGVDVAARRVAADAHGAAVGIDASARLGGSVAPGTGAVARPTCPAERSVGSGGARISRLSLRRGDAAGTAAADGRAAFRG